MTPDEANRLLGVVRARIGDLDAEDGAPPATQVRPRDPGYDLINGGARVPVHGPLVHRLGAVRPWCGMTDYDGIAAAVAVAAAVLDPNVDAILLDIDSPGGEAASCFSVALPALARARALKPLRAIAADCACSAAYAIAAQCEQIYLPETAVVGSIGVITLHADISCSAER